MRIVTFNVNGIRAALKRGFLDWLAASDADVIALQEVRCKPKDLPPDAFGDYYAVYDPGQLAGRNGVALLTKEPLPAVTSWGQETIVVDPNATSLWGGEFGTHRVDWTAESELPDPLSGFRIEGRWIQADLPNAPVTVASLYLPKGGLPGRLMNTAKAKSEPPNSPEKYARKMDFIKGLAQHFETLQNRSAAAGRQLVVLGDYNIAHANQDLKNWKSNQNSEGFLPEERAWMDSVLGQGDAPVQQPLHDVVRELNPDSDGPYSWWSWRGKAFDNDAGWRIDYHLATAGLADTATDARVARADTYDARVSDHAAVVVDYSI